MKKIMQWVLAATLTISGASVMTSCSTDNIADHALEPMQESIIVARQLVQFFNSFVGANVQSEGGFGDK